MARNVDSALDNLLARARQELAIAEREEAAERGVLMGLIDRDRHLRYAMERGTLQVTIDGTSHLLRAGDSAYYAGDCHHQFVNPGREPCVYYLAMALTDRSPHARRGRVPPGGARRRP